jgi:hypothetical protein
MRISALHSDIDEADSFLMPQVADALTQRREAALRLLREAGELGAVCSGYWDDLARCVQQDEEVAYAVDVDIIVLYSDPVKMAIYGELFSDSDAQTRNAAAFLLGDYIVRRMPAVLSASATPPTPEAPGLILIPPHDAELQRVGFAISNAALNSAVPASIAKLSKDKIDLLRGHLSNANGREDSSAGAVVDLLIKTGLLSSLRGPGGPRQELARLEDLEPGRFVALRGHPWFSSLESSKLLPPRRSAERDTPGAAAEYLRFEALADTWHRRLVNVYLSSHGTGPSGGKNQRIVRDAAVLARLQWVNEGLQAQGDSKRRLVLVTGSPTMINAAQQVDVCVPGYTDFASAFVRHPKAFLGAKQLAEHPASRTGAARPEHLPTEDTELHLADWLSVVLPRNVRQSRFEREAAGVLVGTTVKITFQRPTATDLLHTWEGDETGARGLKAVEGFPRQALAQLDALLARLAERMNAQAESNWRSGWARELQSVIGSDAASDPVTELIDLLRRRELVSIDRLYAQTDVVGAVQLLKPNERMRGLPALRFDDEYRDAQDQCDQLCAQLFSRNRPEHFDLQAMESALRKTDPSGYHARVLKAYVFACAGLWFQVRPLCLAALLAVDSISGKREDDKRKGREAAYLLAVAERRLANAHAGIEHAEAALKEAVRRNHLPGDVRFTSESLAQRVSRIQLDFFGRDTVQNVDLLGLMEDAWRLAHSALIERPTVIRRWVVRQCVTNGLMLALIARHQRVQPPQVSGIARRLLTLLAAEGQAPSLPSRAREGVEQLYPDGVSDFVWLVGTAVFGDSAADRDAARAMLMRETQEDRPDTSTSLFIERLRRDRMLQWAGLEIER